MLLCNQVLWERIENMVAETCAVMQPYLLNGYRPTHVLRSVRHLGLRVLCCYASPYAPTMTSCPALTIRCFTEHLPAMPRTVPDYKLGTAYYKLGTACRRCLARLRRRRWVFSPAR
eukprot:3298006-Rhodomonas_salina.1